MDKGLKRNMLLIVFAIVLFAALTNLASVVAFLKGVLLILTPVVVGFLIAFVLSVPMRGFERLLSRLSAKLKIGKRKRLISLASLILTFLCVILIIVLVCTMIIPELVSSVMSLYDYILEKWPEWQAQLDAYGINTEFITSWLESLDLDSLDLGEIVERVSSGAGSIISSAVDIVSSTVSGLMTAGISVILSIYVLLSKDDLARQLDKLGRAWLRPRAYSYIRHVAELVNDTYSKFLSGQCLEACILGFLIFLALSIFAVPYASIIGVLTAVCAFIPYVGAFASCVIGAFLVLLVNPAKALVCVIVYFVVQFVENQFIYPNVVGTSVGMKPIWTLIAVILGGELMGLFGMIFFIPLFAVLITLLRERTYRRLEEKKGPASEPPAASKKE